MTNPATGNNFQILRAEIVNHLTETRHRIFTFYSYQMKLSFYLKLCLCWGSWSEKIPALKRQMKFTAATCEFKHLKSSIKVYLSTQKRPQPSLGSIKFYLFANASLWLLQLWHALEGVATLPWSKHTLPFAVIKIRDRQPQNADIILPQLPVK